MVFTSTVFLFAFFPLSLAAFYLVPPRWRVVPLLLTSSVFYAWGEPVLVVLILLTGLFTYSWGKLLVGGPDGPRRKVLLTVGIAVALVPILVFKYLDFFLLQLGRDDVAARTQLPLPIGVSFYTFMAIGYLVDIYWRRDEGAPRLLAFSGFLTMYPHLVAGPIVRWHDIGPQLAAPRFDPRLFGYGALRVAGGLAKKSVLADSLSVVVDGLFAGGEPTSTGAAWVAALLYSLQIYLDFSAYSDIAIGLAAMMGVRFHENFRYPYVSRSAREFWQRWHISLGSWFRDYVYIPLGGSRVRPLLLWRNLLVVWGLTGLWHGAAWTFVLWGLYYGLVIGLERSVYGDALARTPAPVQHLYGLLVAVLGWVMFRSTSVTQALDYYGSMFGLTARPAWDATAGFAVDQTWVVVLLSVLLAAGVARPLTERAERVLRDPVRPHEAPVGSTASGASDEPVAVPASSGGGTGTLTLEQPVVARAPEEETVAAPPPIGIPFTVLLVVTVAVLMLVATAFITATTYSPFIYFRF